MGYKASVYSHEGEQRLLWAVVMGLETMSQLGKSVCTWYIAIASFSVAKTCLIKSSIFTFTISRTFLSRLGSMSSAFLLYVISFCVCFPCWTDVNSSQVQSCWLSLKSSNQRRTNNSTAAWTWMVRATERTKPARSLPKALQRSIKHFVLFALKRGTNYHETKRLGKVFFTGDKRFLRYNKQKRRKLDKNRQRKASDSNKWDKSNAKQ